MTGNRVFNNKTEQKQGVKGGHHIQLFFMNTDCNLLWRQVTEEASWKETTKIEGDKQGDKKY